MVLGRADAGVNILKTPQSEHNADRILNGMNNDNIILDPVLRRCAAIEREYLYKKSMRNTKQAEQTVHTTDPSHIYTYSGWPLKVELFKDKSEK